MRPAILFDRESIRQLLPQKKPTVYRIYELLPPADDLLDKSIDKLLVYAGATLSPRSRLLDHRRDERFELGKTYVVELEFHRNPSSMARGEATAMEERPQILTNARRHAAWKARRTQPRRQAIETNG